MVSSSITHPGPGRVVPSRRVRPMLAVDVPHSCTTHVHPPGPLYVSTPAAPQYGHPATLGFWPPKSAIGADMQDPLPSAANSISPPSQSVCLTLAKLLNDIIVFLRSNHFAHVGRPRCSEQYVGSVGGLNTTGEYLIHPHATFF